MKGGCPLRAAVGEEGGRRGCRESREGDSSPPMPLSLAPGSIPVGPLKVKSPSFTAQETGVSRAVVNTSVSSVPNEWEGTMRESTGRAL